MGAIIYPPEPVLKPTLEDYVMRAHACWFVPLFALSVVALVTLFAPVRATTGPAAASRAPDVVGTGTPTLTKAKYKLTYPNGVLDLKAKDSLSLTVDDIIIPEDTTISFAITNGVDNVNIGNEGSPTTSLLMEDVKGTGKTLKAPKDSMLSGFTGKATYVVKKKRLIVKLSKGTPIGAPEDLGITDETKLVDEATINVNFFFGLAGTTSGGAPGTFKVTVKNSKKDDTVATSGSLQAPAVIVFP